MRGMNSDTIDLIYLDPPFNSNADYAAPIGSQAAGAEFKDTWTLSDIDLEWLDLLQNKNQALWRVIMVALTNSDKSYLIYMAPRLLEMKRLLKPTGSIYLHVDPTMSHYLKIMMDAIFGRKNFRNEVIWNKGYRGTPRKRRYQQEHDTILMYANQGYTWNNQTVPYKDERLSRYNKTDEKGRKYALIKRRRTDGTVYYGKTYPDGKKIGDVIHIPTLSATTKERTGFKTQKPLALLNRIIQASSNKGDLVFDPFCGCATTCVAAHNLDRQWMGIDLSGVAARLVVERITDAQGVLFKDVNHRTDIPTRTDMGKLPRYNCKENKEKLYGLQAGYCLGCAEHFLLRNLTVDHVIAKSKGGTDHIDNLQLLCGHCNSVKGDRGMEYLQKHLRLAA